MWQHPKRYTGSGSGRVADPWRWLAQTACASKLAEPAGGSRIDIQQILDCLPHRYPMLLVDRMLSLQPGKGGVGLKNVTFNEAFFQGHYPGRPIMPGVLIVEAMAQVGAVVLLGDPKMAGKVPLIGEIEGAKFRRPVVPGDQLITTVELLWMRGSIGKFRAVGRVGEDIAAEMQMIFKLSDKDAK